MATHLAWNPAGPVSGPRWYRATATLQTAGGSSLTRPNQSDVDTLYDVLIADAPLPPNVPGELAWAKTAPLLVTSGVAIQVAQSVTTEAPSTPPKFARHDAHQGFSVVNAVIPDPPFGPDPLYTDIGYTGRQRIRGAIFGSPSSAALTWVNEAIEVRLLPPGVTPWKFYADLMAFPLLGTIPAPAGTADEAFILDLPDNSLVASSVLVFTPERMNVPTPETMHANSYVGTTSRSAHHGASIRNLQIELEITYTDVSEEGWGILT